MAVRMPGGASCLQTTASSSTSISRIRLVPMKNSLSFVHHGGLRYGARSNSITCKTRYAGSGMGPLMVQMNLFARVGRVIKSYVNAVLNLVEDPEKILDQAVIEMNSDMTRMRQATAQVLASQKQLENKFKAAQQASDDWHGRARLALAKGDEDLAREALKRRKSYSANANTLKAQLDQQKSVVDNLLSNTRLLESKIQEAKAKKDSLRARAQSAKTATRVTEILSNVNTSSALSAFEKMEEKVLAMESQAEAFNQLTADGLEEKFALLDTSSVDDDLEKLKNESSGRAQRGELPPGRSSTRSRMMPFQDLEIEKELNELRQRERDI